jgi:methylmalonyl-CoA/ethylmalonyl-CoA epimerase
MIIRLSHIGLVCENLDATLKNYEKVFGLRAVDFRNNQGKGFQFDARIMLANECWLHLVQNWNPEARVNKFLNKHGEGLEHLCLETDDIEADVAYLRKIGVSLFQDTIFNAADGFEAFVFPDDAIGFTVELIQPHANSWKFDATKLSNPNILGLQHIGVAVKDILSATQKFEKLFGLKATKLRTDQHDGKQRDMMIELGNDRLWLHLVESTDQENRVTQFMDRHGEGLEHLCLEVDDIRKAVKQVQSAGIPLYQQKIYLDRADGFESFVYPEYNQGVTIELIEPYPTSRGYRQNYPDPMGSCGKVLGTQR